MLVWTYSEFCVQRRPSGQRVAKDHHVRRQLARQSSVTLGQNISRCLPEQCDRVSWLCLFRTPSPKCNHHHPPGHGAVLSSIVPNWARLCENPALPGTRSRRFFDAAGQKRSIRWVRDGCNMSASLRKRLTSMRCGERPFVPIVLQKSFCTGDQKFCGSQVRFSCKNVGRAPDSSLTGISACNLVN